MSFAGRREPSVILMVDERERGAPGFSSLSSFNRTEAITRTVAVAWAYAEPGRVCGGAIASAEAKRNMGATANALAAEW